MTTAKPPDYGVFLRVGKAGGWAKLIRSLTQGEPSQVPPHLSERRNASTHLRQAAKFAKRTIRTRTIDGQLWVCWMNDEDAK